MITRRDLSILRDLTIIAVVISAVFLTFYWHCIHSGLPLSYDGDAFQVLVGVKGNVTGENNPLTLRFFHQLNAPFSASWSDYPFEKIVSWGAGICCRFFGLAGGTTLAVLLLQVLAGVCFYCIGRILCFKDIPLLAGAILFGLAPYAFLQNLQHLTLTAYWHLPLLVLALLWFGWPERVGLSPRDGLLLSCLSAFMGGNLNPYYLGPFLVLLTFLALGVLITKNWSRLIAGAAIVGSAILGFLLQNADTLVYALQHGRNSEAVSRDLWWMVKFGLYLPDLIFPRAHQNELISNVSWSLYHSHVPPLLWGESQTAYIGMISVVALAAMFAMGIARISAKKFDQISPFFWLTSGLIFFSLAGGVNYLLGSFGFLLLRATNRSSILISCMALYYLCEKFPQRFSKFWNILIVVMLVGFGIWDQLPRYPSWEEAIRQRSWIDFRSDSDFFPALERMLPVGAMVFELPVKDYPEMGPVNDMGDYEHFRPMLHTDALRFSYGAVKGRGDDNWQKKVSSEEPREMIGDLERYGFSAILINRKAYKDRGEALSRKLLEGGAVALKENDDFLILGIHPLEKIELPPRR
jgi:phosphoglycerol transferase